MVTLHMSSARDLHGTLKSVSDNRPYASGLPKTGEHYRRAVFNSWCWQQLQKQQETGDLRRQKVAFRFFYR